MDVGDATQTDCVRESRGRAIWNTTSQSRPYSGLDVAMFQAQVLKPFQAVHSLLESGRPSSSVSVKSGSSFASQKLISLYKSVNVCREMREYDAPDLSETELDCCTEMCSGSEVGSYLRLIDFCITQL